MRSTVHITIENVEFLLGTDSPESIARRLGYKSAKNLSCVLYRAGRPDLGRRIAQTREDAAA